MRKSGIILSLWTALLCFPLSSFALGLGEIEVNSYLNQPLKAEIEVVAARPGEIDDLLVSLASRDAFRKAGLDRSSDLSKLRFKIEKSEDGQSAKILVSTKSAIKEPFLNFLVEADWAKGRLLREYTILLDPPFFAQQPEPAAAKASQKPAPVAQSPEQQPESAAVTSMAPEASEEIQPQPIAMTEQAEAPAASPQPEPQYSAQSTYTETAPSDEEIVVARGDTLWGIASRYKDDQHSMAQVMLAIQAANPDAFANDNINNLKVGAVLRAPETGSFDNLSKQQAYAQVLEQNGLWDDYIARKTGTAQAGSPMAAAEQGGQSGEAESGQLSLLAPGDKDSTTASMSSEESADAAQLRKQLALAEEELEASRLENQDLKSRVSELEAQIKKIDELQKMVQIEDTSLAQLQQQADQNEPTQTPATEPTGTATEEQPSDIMIEAAEKLAAEEGTAEQAAGDEEMQQAAPAEDMSGSTEAETVLPTVPEQGTDTENTMAQDQGSADTMKPEEESEPATVPAPVIVTEAPPEGGIMDMIPSLNNLLADPIMLGGIGAIVLLLIGLLFVRRRKSSEPEEQGITVEEPEELLVDDDATPIHVPSNDDVQAASVEEEDMVDTAAMLLDPEPEAEDDFAKTAIISAEEQEDSGPAATVEDEQDDVLNEVDVYLAYGLYENAEDLLKENLENSPDRADYRAKLLDTYFATRNKDLFIKEAEALKSLGGAADRFWNRVQIMGFELAPENEMFAGAENSDLSVADLEFAKPETADFDISIDDDITDYSNTDFDLGVDTQSLEPVDTVVVAPSGGEFNETQNLSEEAPPLDDFSETMVDDELELGDLDKLDAELEDLPDEIGEFDLDLGDEADGGEEDAEQVDLDDEDALSFDLPEDLDLSTDVEDLQEQNDIIELDDTVEAPDMDKLPEMEDDDVVLDVVSDDELEDLEEDLSEDLEENQQVDLEEDQEEDVVAESAKPNFDSTDEIDLSEISLDEPEDVSQTVVFNREEMEEDMVIERPQSDDALDLDMSDIDSADLQTGSFTPSEIVESEDEVIIDDDADDDITEFRPAEMTGEFEIPDESDALAEVDADAGIEKTGTFAPGDFGDDELDEIAELDGMDDIENLMLPDDVDEVGTKLDLAKAFIDMGDAEGARSSLEEVLSEGTEEQKAEATDLLKQIK